MWCMAHHWNWNNFRPFIATAYTFILPIFDLCLDIDPFILIYSPLMRFTDIFTRNGLFYSISNEVYVPARCYATLNNMQLPRHPCKISSNHWCLDKIYSFCRKLFKINFREWETFILKEVLFQFGPKGTRNVKITGDKPLSERMIV